MPGCCRVSLPGEEQSLYPASKPAVCTGCTGRWLDLTRYDSVRGCLISELPGDGVHPESELLAFSDTMGKTPRLSLIGRVETCGGHSRSPGRRGVLRKSFRRTSWRWSTVGGDWGIGRDSGSLQAKEGVTPREARSPSCIVGTISNARGEPMSHTIIRPLPSPMRLST